MMSPVGSARESVWFQPKFKESMTALLTKLGVKPGHRLVVIGAGPHFFESLGELPNGACFLSENSKEADIWIGFFTSWSAFDLEIASLITKLRSKDALWVAWPKKSSGVRSDLNFDLVQKTCLASGLVDNKVCAIDDVFTGLRFVVPVASRSAWACEGEQA